jgi:hypothetical protein
MPDFTHLGTGAIRAPKDSVSSKFRNHPIFGTTVVDWNVPFFNPEPISNDQNGSGSCVGQAWSYYHEQLKPGKRFSRRDLYSQIALPGSGAYIVAGRDRIVTFGQATRDELADPTPETEDAMTDKTGVSQAAEASDKELLGLSVSLDINQWAAAIRAALGVVGGLEGRWNEWSNLANPNPPPPGHTDIWGHCLYFFGYHMHDGQKCVVAKSSWGNAGNTTVHHIKQNYFDSGYMFNAYTLVARNTLMNQTKIVLGKDGKTVYKATPVATTFDDMLKQAAVEGIEVPNPIPPASTL